jgi:hypothetical protein
MKRLIIGFFIGLAGRPLPAKLRSDPLKKSAILPFPAALNLALNR